MNGVSFSEQVANRSERIGKVLKPDEIEGMRKVCRVRTASLNTLDQYSPGITR